LENQFASDNHTDMRAKPLHDFEDVGGQEDGCTTMSELQQKISNDQGRDGIHTLEGFIEKKQLWIGKKRCG
jgi:hypothetical protein